MGELEKLLMGLIVKQERDPERTLYFGLADHVSWKVETGDTGPSLIFDSAVATSYAAPLLQVLEHRPIPWGLFDLDTAFLTCDLHVIRTQHPNFNPENQRQWWMLTVGPSRGEVAPTDVYSDPTSPEGLTRSIESIVPAPKELQNILERFSESDGIADSTSQQIRALLNISAPTQGKVAVYDVGQGNCNAVCDESGSPLLYFDFGRPLPFNHHTSPNPPPTFCFTKKPPIVLSHWDFDHFGAVVLRGKNWHPYAINTDWIAPRQYAGAIHQRLISKLSTGNRIHFWPKGVKSLKFPLGTLIECTGPNSMQPQERNNSGIAMVAELVHGPNMPPASVLMPGDADFPFVPFIQPNKLSGLVASHHGARVANVPIARMPGRVAFSVGRNNCYGHPSTGVENAYKASGWNSQAFTYDRKPCCPGGVVSSGGIELTQLATGGWPLCPPCYGQYCSLCLTQ